MNDKISVIIPVYNDEAYLTQTIESLLRQSYQNYELIFVDDGSTDGSGKLLDKYADKYKVSVIHQENRGVSAARNVGIQNSTGTYIAFVDGDDEVDSDYLMALYLDMIRYNADMVHHIYTNLFSDGKTSSSSGEDIHKLMTSMEYIKSQILAGKDTSACAKLFKRSIIKKNSLLFSEGISNLEDMLFLFEYSFCTKNVYYSTQSHYNRIINIKGVAFSPFNKKKMTALMTFDKIKEYLLHMPCGFDKEQLLTLNAIAKLRNLIYFMTQLILLNDYNSDDFYDLKHNSMLIYQNYKNKIPKKIKLKYWLIFSMPRIYSLVWKLKNS
jgi:glycosyltransferase involved in cell wall biosynthesis